MVFIFLYVIIIKRKNVTYTKKDNNDLPVMSRISGYDVYVLELSNIGQKID